jgi:hypothetical protein
MGKQVAVDLALEQPIRVRIVVEVPVLETLRERGHGCLMPE